MGGGVTGADGLTVARARAQLGLGPQGAVAGRPGCKAETACWALAATIMLMGEVMMLSNSAKMLNKVGDEVVFMHNNKGQWRQI